MDILKNYVQIHFLKIRTHSWPQKEKKNLLMVISLVLKEVFSPKKWLFKKLSLLGSRYINTSSIIVLELGEREIRDGSAVVIIGNTGNSRDVTANANTDCHRIVYGLSALGE